MPDRSVAPSLATPRRIHVIGAGGAGMSSIASVLGAMGHAVTGSDERASAVLARLAGVGIGVTVGHDPAAVAGADLVTASTAVPDGDPELAEAHRLGIPVLRRAAILAAICAQRRTIAVAGTHGKTTTSSMLALALDDAGLDPSYIIGGDIAGVGPGARWGAGEWLVVEADESDGTFLELGAEAVVVTSVEADHLEHFGSYDALEAAFERFVAAAPGPKVVSADDAGAAALTGVDAAGPVTTFGTAATADWQLRHADPGRSSISFEAVRGDEAVGVHLAVPGLHNARNALAALAVAAGIGVAPDAVARGLGRFRGVGRRFEWRGERDGITFVDDYGHLPGEVAAALAAARDGRWGRVVAVFQPHRYSRTEALWQSFADAFADADIVVVTDVYSSGEAPRPGVTGALVAEAVAGRHAGPVRYVARLEDLPAALGSILRAGDLCLTLGAGDLTRLVDRLVAGGDAT